MTSVLSPPVSGRPVLPAPAFRQRLESVREQLAELEDTCPPETGLDVALDVIEIILTSLGWRHPGELTGRDLAFLAAAGAL